MCDIFAAKYPNIPIAGIATVFTLENKIDSISSIQNLKTSYQTCRIPHYISVLVRAAVEMNYNMSSASSSNDLHISCSSIQRIFKVNEHENYKYSKHHELFRGDSFTPMLFCERLSDLINLDDNLVRNILFTFRWVKLTTKQAYI